VRSWLGAALFWCGFAIAVLTVGLLVGGRGGVLDAAIAPAVGVGVGGIARLLTSRRPDHPVGWLLAVIALLLVAAIACDSYSANAQPGDPEVALQVAVCLGQMIWNLWLLVAVGIALPLLFPDGRLPSRRWRWVAGAGIAGTVIGTIAFAFTPGRIESAADTDIVNPLGIAAAGDALSVATSVSTVLTGVAFLGAAASVVVRLRRSRGVERQQLKWFAYVVVMIVAGLTLATVSSSFGEEEAWGQVAGPVGWFTALIGIAFGIPGATAIAVLRYRLYDIDVVINRTLVYAALTLSLVTLYLGAVLLLQLALGPLTEDNDLAIAGSTLAVAALFRPLRARIQEQVDRRFYRRKYDAGRTIERFGARLREEVSLDSLSAELREVVSETMQPAHVSVWLRAQR
jgi:hypothetical protein